MSFTMPTTFKGVQLPNGYFVATSYIKDLVTNVTTVAYSGYASLADYTASPTGNILSRKIYTVSPDTATKYLSDAAVTASGNTLEQQCDVMALTIVDGPTPARGVTDTRTSFFAAATLNPALASPAQQLNSII